jgi:hypothetical protein
MIDESKNYFTIKVEMYNCKIDDLIKDLTVLKQKGFSEFSVYPVQGHYDAVEEIHFAFLKP